MAGVRTPFFLVDEALIRKNGAILKDVAERAGCKILLAQKAFSMFSMYPLLREYLAGTTASGLYEARLGREEFGGRRMCFPLHIEKMNWMKFLKYATILFLIRSASGNGFGKKRGKAGKALESG